jgi:hypothetical protein
MFLYRPFQTVLDTTGFQQAIRIEVKAIENV